MAPAATAVVPGLRSLAFVSIRFAKTKKEFDHIPIPLQT